MLREPPNGSSLPAPNAPNIALIMSTGIPNVLETPTAEPADNREETLRFSIRFLRISAANLLAASSSPAASAAFRARANRASSDSAIIYRLPVRVY